MTTTIICYLVVAAAILFAVPGMLQTLCSIPIALMFRRVLDIRVMAFIGGFLAWALIGFAWHLAEGGVIPIAVLAVGFVSIFVHGFLSRDTLTKEADLGTVVKLFSVLYSLAKGRLLYGHTLISSHAGVFSSHH